MSKAIITGANGFVGGAIVRELLANGYEVWASDREGVDNNIPEHPLVHKVPADLNNLEPLAQEIPAGEYDLFYHLAWAGISDADRGSPEVQLRNITWTVNALKLAKALGCKRFLCAGSIMERETLRACLTQGNRPGIGYVYGSAKLAAHTICMSLAAELGIELVWPMITNTYGVGERSGRLINTTIQKCIRGEAPRFTAATQIYDFIYIDDVARAFRLIGENGKPFYEYIIGSGQAKPLKEFLLELKAVVAPELDFIFGDIPYTGVDMPLSDFDSTETESDTGFRPSVSFAEGCRRTFEWWQRELGA